MATERTEAVGNTLVVLFGTDSRPPEPGETLSAETWHSDELEDGNLIGYSWAPGFRIPRNVADNWVALAVHPAGAVHLDEDKVAFREGMVMYHSGRVGLMDWLDELPTPPGTVAPAEGAAPGEPPVLPPQPLVPPVEPPADIDPPSETGADAPVEEPTPAPPPAEPPPLTPDGEIDIRAALTPKTEIEDDEKQPPVPAPGTPFEPDGNEDVVPEPVVAGAAGRDQFGEAEGTPTADDSAAPPRAPAPTASPAASPAPSPAPAEASADGAAGNVVGERAQVTVGDDAACQAGNRGQATAGYAGEARAGVEGQATTGDRGSSTAGDRGQATAGASGRAVAGDRGQAVTGERGLTIAGNAGQAVSGDRGDAEAGEAGLAVAGYNGIAVAGARGQAVAGDEGEAEAGDEGYALAGLRGLAAVGAAGLAVAGIGGSARAGIGGVIAILHRAGGRLRLAVGHVGEDGLQPGRLYHLDEAGGFVPDDEAGVDETPLSRGGDGEEAEPIGALALDDDSARQVREVAETPDPGNAAFERVIPPREPPKPDHDDSTGGLTAARP